MLLKLLGFGLLGFLFLKIVTKWLRRLEKFKKTIDRIPGPPGKPLIGNTLNFLVSPEEMWDYLRKLGAEYYPIYKYWELAIPVINLLSPEDMEIVLPSIKHSAKSIIYNVLHPWLGTGLLTSRGRKWQARRKILTPAFHFNILEQFMGIFAEESERLVNELQKECDKPYTDVVPFVTQFALHSICETAMGTRLGRKDEKPEEYTNAIFKMGELLLHRLNRPWLFWNVTFALSPTYQEQKKNLNIIHTFTKSVIENRKLNFQEPENLEAEDGFKGQKRLAMLDLLISAKNSGQPIDDKGIREEVDTFMFEGHDTTTACISFTLMILACHPEVQEKILEELYHVLGYSNQSPTIQDLQNLRYLECAIKESLRMYPSVPLISRVSKEELRTHTGYVIPANTIIQLHIYDLHHNADLYPEPYKFDPDRFLPENVQKRHPFAYIPFSAGPRNCIGQKFAMLEIKTVIAAILRSFVLEAVDRPADLVMIMHLVMKTKNGIKIKFHKRGQSKVLGDNNNVINNTQL